MIDQRYNFQANEYQKSAIPANQTKLSEDITLLPDGSLLLMVSGASALVNHDGPHESDNGLIYRSSLGGSEFQFDIYTHSEEQEPTLVTTLTFGQGRWYQISSPHATNEPHLIKPKHNLWTTRRGFTIGGEFWRFMDYWGTITSVNPGEKYLQLALKTMVGESRTVEIYGDPKQYWKGMKCMGLILALTNRQTGYMVTIDSSEADYTLTFVEQVVFDYFKPVYGMHYDDLWGNKARPFFYRFWLNTFYAHRMSYYPIEQKEALRLAAYDATGVVQHRVPKPFSIIPKSHTAWKPKPEWNKIDCDEAFIH